MAIKFDIVILFQSDDDVNTTTSDIDSQPATPSSQVDIAEARTPIYTDDGLFKVPRVRNDSNASYFEQEYSIAKQTRSKISLAETPIEVLESTFKPPDVPLDMYQVEPDFDREYLDFLFNTCLKPIGRLMIHSFTFFFSVQ